MPTDRYSDLQAMSPMVVGAKNVLRFAADINGVPQISTKGAAFVPLIDLTPQVLLVGANASLVFGGTVIPGLQAWGKATDAVLAAGASWPNVLSVPDRTGLGSRDLTAVGAPTLVPASINGRAGIRCVPATPTYLTNTTASLPMGDRGARTIFFVGIGRSVNGGYQVSNRIAAGAFLSAHRNSASTIFAHLGGSGDNQTLVGLPNINGIAHIWEHSHDGRQAIAGADSAARVLIDGVEQGITAGGFAVAETGTAGWSVGSFTGDTGNGWDGEWSEYIVFNRLLSAAERMLVRSYLSTSYSITVPSVLNTVETLPYGDSTWYGTGDATTIAAGGPRQSLFGQFPRLRPVGSFYTPKSLDATFNRCEGNVGFNSGTNPATGIGGSFLEGVLAAHQPALILLHVGENDAALTLFTALQTGANIRAICDRVYSLSPLTKILVCRAIKQTSAFPAVNAVIQDQGPAIEAALGPSTGIAAAPNVLAVGPGGTRCLIPPDYADSLYADTLHLTPAGQAVNVAKTWAPALTAAGYK